MRAGRYRARLLWAVTLGALMMCACVRARGEGTGPTAPPGDGKTTVDETKTVKQLLEEEGRGSAADKINGFGGWDLVKMLVLVVVVTGGIYGAARLLKKYVPGARGMFGGTALKVVGRMFLSPKQSIVVVKVGRRMVVVGVTPTEIRRLSEITDADEVEEMSREIAGTGKGSTTKEFQEELKKASKEYESGRELLESTGTAGEKTRAMEGIRNELESISKKINLWRKASE